MTERCFWCNTDPAEAAGRHEGPHATWCVHFRESQRGGAAGEMTDKELLVYANRTIGRSNFVMERMVMNQLKARGLKLEPPLKVIPTSA